MEFLSEAMEILANLSMGAKLVIGLFFFVAAVGQWKLYDKAGQQGWTIFVPVLNLIVLNRIVGRPKKHVWYYFIPVYNIFFICKVWIEVCQSFGKKSIVDYVFAIALNGLYMLNLGLSYDEEYKGPVYIDSFGNEANSVGKAGFA